MKTGPNNGDTPEDGGAIRPPAGATAPTPVRAATGSHAAVAPEPAPDPGLVLDAGGERWVVRSLGTARCGPSTAPVTLILVGFDPVSPLREGRREAMVVGSRLEDLSGPELRTAWEGSAARRDPWSPEPFFPQASRRGERDG